jgi:glutamate dehydrogenase
LFDENYALAATQNLSESSIPPGAGGRANRQPENKDIPEGGAKGTILPQLNANFKQSFERYVDVSI